MPPRNPYTARKLHIRYSSGIAEPLHHSGKKPGATPQDKDDHDDGTGVGGGDLSGASGDRNGRDDQVTDISSSSRTVVEKHDGESHV